MFLNEGKLRCFELRTLGVGGDHVAHLLGHGVALLPSRLHLATLAAEDWIAPEPEWIRTLQRTTSDKCQGYDSAFNCLNF